MVKSRAEEEVQVRARIRRNSRSRTAKSSTADEPVAFGSEEKKRKIMMLELKERSTPCSELVVCGNLAAVEKSVYALVKETLRTFNRHYLHFIQEELKRCSEVDKKMNTTNAEGAKLQAKRSSKRPDLKAITEMMKNKTTLYPEKRIGSIPGVEVGHEFFSRAEMVVVGFHQHWLNGIDYIGKSEAAARKSSSDMGYRNDQLPLTTSIVVSGQYEDDLDNCEEIVYTGQGGNNLLGNKRQISDQVLQRGNLGLKNCMLHSVPVRVTRGHKCSSSYVGKVYTYDGLYKVAEYWAEKGVSGFVVYKFRLKRLEGQPPLKTKEVLFIRGRIPKSLSEIRGLVSNDVTGGLERAPIPVTNLVDPPISIEGFAYINRMKFRKHVPAPNLAPKGCKCRGNCNDPKMCACAKLNGGDFPYVHRNVGRLIEPKAVVFECGPNCGCGPECINRTSQNGIIFRLEVFRTPKKGWGVRSWDHIPAGAPICEYIGLVRKSSDLNPADDDSYVFDIDCLQTMQGLDGRESRLRDVKLPWYLEEIGKNLSDSVPFCIDAAKTGNIARFINHSCQPNLFVQCVLSDHHDINLARVMLFAADNIPPLQELTYDYCYTLDSVVGPDGNVRQMPCYCGAVECRKRLY